MSDQSETSQYPRLRFPFLCLLVFWVATVVLGRIDKPYFVSFMSELALAGLLTLCFAGWWWFNRNLRFADKLLGFVVVFGEAWIVKKYSDHSITGFTLWMGGLPIVASVIVAWLYLVKRFRIPAMRLGFLAMVTLSWSYFLLIRVDGADGTLYIRNHWRWTPTAEQQFLAQAGAAKSKTVVAATNAIVTADLAAGDWIEFRGTNRDGVMHGTTIATNWSANPPALIWKRAIGPAWSSVIVVGNRLFTQEQRGVKEVVAGYDASTGSELWIHEDATRFDESVSGPGPRSTPTFSKGRIYTLGGTGLLNCLDAATGKSLWRRDIKEPSGARVPSWAFSTSPLVADGLVIVYAGGETGKGLLAYRAESGDLAWTAPAGVSSYSSAQLTTIDGVAQCLIMHDSGLSSVEVATGKPLWQTGAAMKGAPRCGQPRLLPGNQLLVAVLGGLGCSLIEVTKKGEAWNVVNKWDSRDLKPEFPDFVTHNGYAYGFDIGMFCCINIADGKRAWKEGRNGRGEVVLLADQGLLLITSETGELVLLAADATAHKELGRFQALEGKTWNHPVVRGNRVYLRNAQEMACYEISEKPAQGK